MGVGLVRGENIEMGTLENNKTTHQVRVFVQKKMGQERKLRKNKEGWRTRRIRRESKKPN